MFRRLDDIRTGPKLIAGFSIVALLCTLIGFEGLRAMRAIRGDMASIYNDRVLPLQQLKSVSDSYAVDIVNATHKVRDGSMTWARTRETLAQARTTIDASWGAYSAHIVSAHEAELGSEIERLRGAADAALDDLAEILRLQDYGALEAFSSGSLYQEIDPITTKVDELVALQLAEAGAKFEAASASYDRARIVMAVIVLLAVAVAMLAGIAIARGITGRLATVVAALDSLRGNDIAAIGSASEALARGEIGTRIHSVTEPLARVSKDEVGVLAASINGIIDQTRRTADAFGQAQNALGAVIAETNGMVTAARGGDMAARGDTGRHHGGFRDTVAGINELLEVTGVAMSAVSAALEKAAERDLTARVDGHFVGDFADMQEKANRTLSNLDAALREVATASAAVASASVHISDGSQQLASGASDQASSLEEVSSSLQEMASMTQQTADNARQARALVDGASASVALGVGNMSRLASAVEKIQASSDATSRIVKTIDEIAFQTNLLALNAAVEAARAGEAGRSFAVVAEEVRNLARRSADAAKNTAALIEESIRNADGGVAVSTEVMKSLDDIQARVSKVGEVTAEIAAASGQQRDGVAQINSAVDQMNGVTQQVAASSQESAHTADELAAQAARLRSLVDSFALSDAAHGAAAPAPAHAAPRAVAGNGAGNGRSHGSRRAAALETLAADHAVLAGF